MFPALLLVYNDEFSHGGLPGIMFAQKMSVLFSFEQLLKWFLVCILVSVTCNKCASNIESKRPADQAARWAIVALARPGKTEINQRNRLLAEKLRPYASKHNITVVVFSEKQFPAAAISNWKNTFAGIANVALIDTSSRGFTGPERYGYKYMCKFFSLDIYDYLRDNYDYYMRCDTDCYIDTLNYDILQWSEDNRVGYGFAMRKLEAHKPTAQTLPAWSAAYMTQCGISQPSAMMDAPLTTCFNFYNNWHIGRVSFFNRPDVRHYLETVNASGHILSHRWGDSTIQAYAVRLFMHPAEIIQVPEFKYIHGSHGNKVVSTFGKGEQTNVPQKLPNWKYSG